MKRHVGVVVNPERTDVADEFVERLAALGCSVTTVTPDAADGLGEAIDELVAAGVDAVAAIGGDGTQRTAAARLAGGDVAFAVVPGGTVNLLAQVLGVDELEHAATAAAGTQRRSLDIGRMNDECFVLNSSTGWDADIIGSVGDTTKRFGRLGFVAAGLATWVRTRAIEVEIELDGERWFDGRAVTVLVLNVGERGSDSLHIAPAAEFDDGRLDVVVLRRHSVPGFLRFALAIARGDRPPPRDAVVGQAERISVRWSRPVRVQCDGDARYTASVVAYDVAPESIDVMIPTG